MVQEARIKLAGGLVACADNEDFCRGVTRCLRLGRVHPMEQLPESKQKRSVVSGTEDFGNECAFRPQEFAGQLT